MATDTPDVFEAIGVIAAVVIVIAILVAVVGALAPAIDHLVGGSDSWNPDAGQSHTLTQANERPIGLDVRATTEEAIRLETEAAHVQADIRTPPDNWTVCAVPELADDANQQAAIDIVAIENETITLRFDAGVWRARYDPQNKSESPTATHVNASTPTDPTPLCTRWNGTHLLLDAPNEHSSAAAGNDEQRNVSVGLEGDLDELRVLNESVSDDDVDRYLNDPIEPLTGTNHTARLMFDAGEGSTDTVYYASSDATLVGNTSWVAGVPDPGLVEGTDYEIDIGPLRVTPLNGGYLEGAPVAYASWGGTGFGAVLTRLWRIGGSALTLLVVGLLAVASMAIYREFTW